MHSCYHRPAWRLVSCTRANGVCGPQSRIWSPPCLLLCLLPSSDSCLLRRRTSILALEKPDRSSTRRYNVSTRLSALLSVFHYPLCTAAGVAWRTQAIIPFNALAFQEALGKAIALKSLPLGSQSTLGMSHQHRWVCCSSDASNLMLSCLSCPVPVGSRVTDGHSQCLVPSMTCSAWTYYLKILIMPPTWAFPWTYRCLIREN